MADVKETKAQRVERLKRELNPWEAYAEIERFAREGWDSIPPEWWTYFRWWGVYSQGDGVGAVGGVGGEGKAAPYLMLRVRIPGGVLASHQLRAIADLSERYARGIADITVRQNFQLHWISIEALPEVVQTLWRTGLTSLGACGDVPRNVTGCPVAGVDADEIVDATPLVQEATRLLNGNADFYNLPRKFKVSINGCRVWCAYPEVNDVGISALRHPASGEVGFSVRVGGGLAADPHLAVPLDIFARTHQVVPIVRGVTEIFRDTDVLRERREKARLKFLFLQYGWTAERFREELEARVGFPLDRAPREEAPDDIYRDHVGIHPQRQAGLVYAGVTVPRGRMTPAEMRAMADAADRFGTGELRATNMQNLVITNVRRENASSLVSTLQDAGLQLGGSPFRRGTIACTGTEFCKLALTETKGFALRLVQDLEARLPGFEQHLKIHITGCPNSCGQHWIADIGLEGKKQKVNGTLVDAYYFCVGGAVGRHQATARPVGLRLPALDVAPAIERLLRAYLDTRQTDENFRAFTARHSDEALRALLAGGARPAVARDAAGGLIPASVDG